MGLKLNGSSSGSVELNAPADTTSGADVVLTLPVNDGDANQFLQTNGSGAMSFAVPANLGTAATASGTDLQFNSGYGSVATAYGCRAWVNFNGTGTVAIRDQGNVSSVTDDGTGIYTVNLTTAMPDVNYVVNANCSRGGGGTNLVTETNRTDANTTSAVALAFRDSNFNLQDMNYVYVAIFR